MFWQGFLTGLSVGAIIFGVWVGLIARKQLAIEAALGNLLYEALTELLSIPQWCDCCAVFRERQRVKGKCFQSHNGAIAAYQIYIRFTM